MKPQQTPTRGEMFSNWTPRELEALDRATALLRAMQPPAEQPRYSVTRKISKIRNKHTGGRITR